VGVGSLAQMGFRSRLAPSHPDRTCRRSPRGSWNGGLGEPPRRLIESARSDRGPREDPRITSRPGWTRASLRWGSGFPKRPTARWA